MKKIIVLSAGRSDFDRIEPILKKLNKKKYSNKNYSFESSHI